ncbi:glutaredoxin domain-containing protein [Oscillatoria sp. CS-180]|uniref:glutaredoxin domain-containing protein n=1 Tax=Oscillatoria sp. CS-180 TaxID=3021720 RepID=UPI00232CFB85|nr:glutaredoxin domain-containing protein [Oscillatoria sp. CS-180]
MTQNIQIFTKSSCSFCARAKALLSHMGLDYKEINVEASDHNENLSVSLSGVATVPQIFIGSYHINGVEDLERLQASGRLLPIVEAARGSSLAVADIPAVTAQVDAEDWALSQVIPATDGSRSTDPETWALLRFYKDFFGFWPNTFAYLYHWPDAYKLFVYCHNFSAVGYGKKVLGPLNMFTVGYSTSNVHGCNYCQVHSAATGGEQSLQAVRQFKAALAGERSAENPYGDLELAIANLAAEATRNAVTEETLNQIQQLSADAQQAQAYITGVEMMVAAFGFLNVFNDLTGLELEGKWAQQASEQTGIDAGRHQSTQDENPANLDYDLPQGGPSIEDMLAKYSGTIEDLAAYGTGNLGLFPNWIKRWPQPLQKHHAYLYGELMGEKSHTLLSAELRHLMARVSAIAKDHTYLAAVEGFMAYRSTQDSRRAIARIRDCFEVATGRMAGSELFSGREQAALQFAWISAQMPLTTPRKYVQAAVEQFSEKELIHLIVACSVASMVQRFVAIARPEIEAEVAQFLKQNNLETDTLKLRYPLPVDIAQLVA